MQKIIFKRLTVKEKKRINAGKAYSDINYKNGENGPRTYFDCPPPDPDKLSIGNGCIIPYTGGSGGISINDKNLK